MGGKVGGDAAIPKSTQDPGRFTLSRPAGRPLPQPDGGEQEGGGGPPRDCFVAHPTAPPAPRNDGRVRGDGYWTLGVDLRRHEGPRNSTNDYKIKTATFGRRRAPPRTQSLQQREVAMIRELHAPPSASCWRPASDHCAVSLGSAAPARLRARPAAERRGRRCPASDLLPPRHHLGVRRLLRSWHGPMARGCTADTAQLSRAGWTLAADSIDVRSDPRRLPELHQRVDIAAGVMNAVLQICNGEALVQRSGRACCRSRYPGCRAPFRSAPLLRWIPRGGAQPAATPPGSDY